LVAVDEQSRHGVLHAEMRKNAAQRPVIRRAAFQKPQQGLILMMLQRNFDRAAGFCQRVVSARFRTMPNRSQ
jgi:hypothetical protein